MNKDIFDYFDRELLFNKNTEFSLMDDYRLDPSHYVSNTDIIVKRSLDFDTLANFIASIEEPNLFTRYYCDKIYGIPYISSSEMSEIDPPIDKRFISSELTKNVSQYLIKRGQVLVSAAGTVGSIVVATEKLNGVAGTSDILRINFNHSKNRGYIYTYLTSEFGVRELNNLAYGAIIKRIRGFQLSNLKVPVLDSQLTDEMDNLIELSLTKREQAGECIKLAKNNVIQYNNLPPLSLDDIETLDPNKETQIQLISSNEFTHSYRLDAHFYNPFSKKTIANIITYSHKYKELHELATCSFNGGRSIRNYVDKQNGIPFLSGKNIIQIRPDYKYVSLTETANLQDMMVSKNQLLVSRSGTLGRLVLIWNNYENCCASEHLIRISTNSKIIDPGYLYAFLSSDYGYYQLIRHKHGSVIDEINEYQISQTIIPILDYSAQIEIGDLVRQAFDLRAEAIKLEDQAQEILTKALTE